MKRLSLPLTVVFLAALVQGVFAFGRYNNGRVTIIKLGYFAPKDVKSGLMGGIMLGSAVDENVDIGISVDYFSRTFKKDQIVAKTVSAGGVVQSTVQRTMDFSTHAIPIMANIIVKFSSRMPFTFFLGGGLGYELLFNKETNYKENISEKRFYHGVGWQLEGGAMFRIGRYSWFFGEVFYNEASPSRNKNKNAQGLPTWEEVDFSGVGARVGFRLGGF
ncbi:hypothetical protein BMS3Abin05_01470 [bacterium BMS3Abin05]|nr:hypothetical protein BMS3Abin05_01470 [bacterium BMS3Abin05]GBE27715.1 hypothetical protein BMS3Bbin03_01644 [bacterium BMS3Bbin03]HDK35548.1 hypothetical protein [Bacteroidota bacterium]HDZ10878.1 hypothetical protein [Bacteroidota bacterium]